MNDEKSRQLVQRLKELPTMAPDVEKIVRSCEDPKIHFSHLSQVLATSPTITARLLGLANSAFFGQQGRVHTLEHALAVLGMPTVRSIATGLALAGLFRVAACPRFCRERYWLTAMLTATFGKELQTLVSPGLRLPFESVHLAGLLHNLGLLALVHLFPASVDTALADYERAPAARLGRYLEPLLGLDHYQAGAWLGNKWHLPREILLVMEHHHDFFYRGEQWPLVLLIGVSARWAVDLLRGEEFDARETNNAYVIKMLGISPAAVLAARGEIAPQLAAYREMAATLATGLE